MWDFIAFLILALAINKVLFLPAFYLKTDKLTDFTYGLTFFAVAIFAYMRGPQNLFQTIMLTLIFIWAIRLSGFLVIRIRKMGRDKRFDEVRDKFWSFLSFWLLQGFSAWLILLPSLLLLTRDFYEIHWLAALGAAIWGFGIVTEAIADYQKYKFKSNPRNKDKWIESGLWKYSRHPNYFGEFLCWLGLYVFSLQAASFVEGIFLLISPLYILWILTKVTGIPTLDKEADKRWGKDKNYQNYKSRTSLFVLLPRRSK